MAELAADGGGSGGPQRGDGVRRVAKVARNKELGLADLSANFHVPINTAARNLGVCVTVLKQVCRELGVQRWPYRKVKKIDDMVKIIETGDTKETLTGDMRARMDRVKETRDFILQNPNSTAHKRLGKVKSLRAATDKRAAGDKVEGGAGPAHALPQGMGVGALGGALGGDPTAGLFGGAQATDWGANGGAGGHGVPPDGAAYNAGLAGDGAAGGGAGGRGALSGVSTGFDVAEITQQAMESVHAMFNDQPSHPVLIAAAASASAAAVATSAALSSTPGLPCAIPQPTALRAAKAAASNAATAVAQVALQQPAGWFGPMTAAPAMPQGSNGYPPMAAGAYGVAPYPGMPYAAAAQAHAAQHQMVAVQAQAAVPASGAAAPPIAPINGSAAGGAASVPPLAAGVPPAAAGVLAVSAPQGAQAAAGWGAAPP